MKIIVCALIAFNAGAVFWQKTEDPVLAFCDVAMEDRGAHAAWGVPLAGGAIRTLFIAPSFAMQDAAELARRIEMDFDIAPVWDARRLGCPEPGSGFTEADALRRLCGLLEKDYDLIAIGNVCLSIFPEAVVDMVIAKVAGGAGLLLTHCKEDMPPEFEEFLERLVPSGDAGCVTRGIGESITPEWPASLGFVKASVFKDGRVVVLDYPGNPPFTHFLMPLLAQPLYARDMYFDTYLSLVAKAARWAAKREPGIWIDRIEDVAPKGPPDAEIPPGLPEEYVQRMREGVTRQAYRPFVIHLSAATDRKYQVRAQVREPKRGLSNFYPELPVLEKGETSYTLEVLVGPGDYFLDLWLLDGKRVVEWHSEAITLKGWPEFSDLSLSKDFLLPNDSLDVALTVQPLYERPRPCAVYVRGTDSFGRVVAEACEALGPKGGRVQLTLHLADLIAALLKVEIFVVDSPPSSLSRWDLERAAYAYKYFPVRVSRPARGFHVVAEARAIAEYDARGRVDTLSRMGVDAVCTRASDEARFFIAEAGLRAIPRLTSYAPSHAEAGIRTPCLTDPGFREAEASRLKELAAAFWTVSPPAYSLGSGNCLAIGGEKVCQSPTCLEGFRAWLQTAYPGLDMLNHSWGTAFASWDTVTDNAIVSGGHASGLDFRRYMDTVFCEAHVAGRKAVAFIDPDALVGFRAADTAGPYAGYDWSMLASELGALIIPPNPVLVEKVRSYRPAYVALCHGGPMVPGEIRWQSWYQVLHGIEGMWLSDPYGGSEDTPSAAALTPGGRPSRLLADALPAIEELKAGIGTLLVNAERPRPEIAIYASQTSAYLNALNPVFATSQHDAELSFLLAIEALGRQYDFVSSNQAVLGELNEYRLVILPMARSLSDDEIIALAEYNGQGGHVLADLTPGRFDEHGAPRATSPLAQLFGIRNTGPAKAGRRAKALVYPGPTELPHTVVDLSVETTDGKPGGTARRVPVWIERGHGEGAGVLLNHAVTPELPIHELLGNLLDELGIERAAPVYPAKGIAFDGECVKLAYGKAGIAAFLAAPHGGKAAQKLLLRLDKGAFVRDMRNPELSPRGRRTRLKARSGEALVYASLPYKVEALCVTVPDEIAAGRRLPVHVAVVTDGDIPGKHLVHLSVTRGLGECLPHYARDIVCENGEGGTFVPLALNDRADVYTLAARDVLTGVSARASVRVSPDFGRLLAP